MSPEITKEELKVLKDLYNMVSRQNTIHCYQQLRPANQPKKITILSELIKKIENQQSLQTKKS